MKVKNWFIKTLVQLWKKVFKPNIKDWEYPRFLIVSTTGLGDTLWGTPAIKSLRSSYPNGYIAVLTSPIGEEVLKHNPHIDEIFVVKNPMFFSLLSLFPKLWKRKIETALIFHTSQRPIIPFCSLLGASEIIGTEKINKGLDFLFTKPLAQKPIHEIERRLNIIGETRAKASHPYLELHFSNEDEEKAQDFLRKYHDSSYIPLIGLHPGAKDAFKRWPPHLFIELGNRLKDHLGCQIIISGNESEKNLVEKIAKGIEGSIPICGDLPLRPFAVILKKMSLFITNDTGPMHVAFAMNTPTVALFTPTDPKLCGPYLAPYAAVIRKPLTCGPCLRKKCQEPFCLLQISPQEVFDAAIQMFYARNQNHLNLGGQR